MVLAVHEPFLLAADENESGPDLKEKRFSFHRFFLFLYLGELDAGNPAVAEEVLHLLGESLDGEGGEVGEGLELLEALRRPHLHAADLAAVGGESRQIVVGLAGRREGNRRPEAVEGRHHVGLGNTGHGGGGGHHRGSHGDPSSPSLRVSVDRVRSSDQVPEG